MKEVVWLLVAVAIGACSPAAPDQAASSAPPSAEAPAPSSLNANAPAAVEATPTSAAPAAARTEATPTATAPPAPARAEPVAASGAGRAVVERVCTACHAIEVITSQRRTASAWNATITRMEGYGLEASDADMAAIRAYLHGELTP